MSRAVARLVLLTAVFAGPDAAAAQNGTASVSAETVCRAAPRPSADAVAMLEAGDVVLYDFPHGRHIAEAVEEARTVIGHGLVSCMAARGRDTDSRDARMWVWSGWDRSGAKITRELRATLEAVSDEDKAPLLEQLAELEACAA